MQTLIRVAAALAILAAAPVAHAATDATAKKSSNCFASNNWNGWTTADKGDALYLRVGLRDYYKVELTPGTHARKGADQFLINEVRGSSWICSHLDLDLAISDSLGFRQPLIATSLRKLTPAEVAAIPKKDLP
ncbi:hypothetical protein LJR219_000552 [Phenylobacterium sp. LjRoot219]|uniref:DUF6491 family protein n=1 Tax=Phenylobacterium sp. LjRoot219 TaxID=3342283 RepID=UPI003ECD4D0F